MDVPQINPYISINTFPNALFSEQQTRVHSPVLVATLIRPRLKLALSRDLR